MTRRFAVLATLLLALTLSACSTAFVSSARAVDIQKATAEESMRQWIKLHDNKQISDTMYGTGKLAYTTWTYAENVARDVLTAWKRQLDAKAANKPADAIDWKGRLDAAVNVAKAASDSFLTFVNGLVDVTGIRAAVSK